MKYFSEKFCSKVCGDFHRSSDIIFRISRLFADHLCNFTYPFEENRISSLKIVYYITSGDCSVFTVGQIFNDKTETIVIFQRILYTLGIV